MRAAFNATLSIAFELGWNITGEHGLRSLEAAQLARQLDPPSQEIHQKIKGALDLDGVLNPGEDIALAVS